MENPTALPVLAALGSLLLVRVAAGVLQYRRKQASSDAAQACDRAGRREWAWYADSQDGWPAGSALSTRAESSGASRFQMASFRIER